MKQPLILLLGLLPMFANGQITVTASDMPQVNHSYYSNFVLDAALLDVSSTGANYTWDFSSVVSAGQDTLYAAPVS